jgi:hypothetical protein
VPRQRMIDHGEVHVARLSGAAVRDTFGLTVVLQ